MNVLRFESYNKNKTHEEPLQTLINRTLETIDLFLRFLQQKNPNKLQIIVDELYRIFQDLATESYSEIHIPDSKEELTLLKDHPKLLQLSKAVILRYLDFSQYKDRIDDEKTDFKIWDNLKSLLVPRYYMVSSLLKVMPASEAIEFIKDYSDYRIAQEKEWPQFASFKDFKDMFQESFKTSGAHNAVGFEHSKGTFGTKITKCMWFEVEKEIKNFNPQIGHAMTCHADFAMAPRYNSNFKLTRTQTLMEGAKHCDFCWHDTQVVAQVEHPALDIWEKL